MGFELLVPEDQNELFTLMEEGDYHLLAGGTDLFVKIEKGMVNPDRIIDISEVLGKTTLKSEEEQVEIPATTTHGELTNSPMIQNEFPVLADSAEAVGAVQLRNMATIGGNICNASPSADTLIALYALNARLKLKSRDRTRTILIEDFINGPGNIELKDGELLESVIIPKVSDEYEHYFKKIGRRNALDISVCSMGYLLKENSGKIEDVRIAYGAVAPRIIRPTSLEEFLQGKPVSREVLPEAKELLEDEISPISDIRGSAEYRKEVALRQLEEVVT